APPALDKYCRRTRSPPTSSSAVRDLIVRELKPDETIAREAHLDIQAPTSNRRVFRRRSWRRRRTLKIRTTVFRRTVVPIVAIGAFIAAGTLQASSHREAPLISQDPLADNTDVYAFVSPASPDHVTLIANYIPFESPTGGPNFFKFDDNVLYEIM